MAVMELYRKNIRPLDIMTEKAFHNALTADMALGCSTNSMLHLPAIANECSITINLDMANEISAKTPNLCHLAPAGHTYMEDLNEAGGVYAVLSELNKKGLINTDVMTVTGRTLGENIKGVVNRNPEIIRTIDNPYSETGGIAVLRGNLAPDGCVVKRSAVAPETVSYTHLIAKSGRPGPVLVDVPKDVQIATTEFENKKPFEPYKNPQASDEQLKIAAEMIAKARKPYIYCGGGIISGNAGSEVMEFAELIDAPIGCSMMGVSAVPCSNPRFLGMRCV